MKKIAFVGILTLACTLGLHTGIAGATPASINNWSGLYIGPSIGTATNRDNGVSSCVNPSGVVNGTGCPAEFFGNIRANGGLAGGQIGYNWQFNRFVVGPEVQFDTSTITGGTSFPNGTITYIGGGGSNPLAFNATETIGWIAAARLRLGYAVSEKALVYLSGGYARMNGNVVSSYVFNGSTPTYYTNPNIQENGFIGGVGGEWQFQPRVSFRFEVSEFNFPSQTLYGPESTGGGYLEGKTFSFRGYTLTGGVNVRI